jgi:subtilisin-like proprotein convertase family protein
LLTNSIIVSGETNWQITIGMTNQWHFYVVTNTTGYTNAAFVTFIPDTLSIPRMGVFADSQANATRPEADIDLYVTTDSNLLTLNPTSIYAAASNYLASVSGPTPNVFATAGGIFEMASLSRGGTEYVVDTNSRPNEVYYIGVKSEDQMASEYGFIPIFSATPFSQMNTNGSEIVNGAPVPVNILDGTPAHPGYGYVFGVAIYPIEVRRVVVTNQVWHQNFGDLIGTLTLNGGNLDVLNNHDSLGNTVNFTPFVYDDSGQGDIAGSQPSDGPGSLNGFIGQKGNGVWGLTEVDDSWTQIGVVQNFSLTIEPHLANNGVTFTATVAGGTWFYDYIDVPPGATNLTITVTNLTTPSPQTVELFVKYGSEPTTSDFDEMTNIDQTTSIPPEVKGSISIGPPLTAGRYFFGVFNPSATPQTVSITATYYTGAVPEQFDYASTGTTPLKDDAVTTSTIPVPDNATISSVDVGLRVDHPRISDLVFHLISPDGTRVLLVENRGGTSTNGMGMNYSVTNVILGSASGGRAASTNVIDTGQTSGVLTINYNFYPIPDEMEVYYQGALIFDSGAISGSGVTNISYGPGTNTQVKIVMNQNITPPVGDQWDYAVSATEPRFAYLTLTENTNLTTTPIKFAPPPFVPSTGTNFIVLPIPTNVVVLAGPIFNPVNGHAYYLLGTNGWTNSEAWAEELGGHLATIRDANEDAWVYDTFAYYGGTGHNLWIGLYDTNLDANCPGDHDGCHSNNFGWVSGEPVTYTHWAAGEPNNIDDIEFYTFIWGWGMSGGEGSSQPPGYWNDEDNYALTAGAGRDGNGVVEVIITNSTFAASANLDLNYLPEQSLDAFARKNAYGTWTLEIQDDRAGATNNATLVSWQLRFTYTTAFGTLNGVPPQTNSIPPSGIVYYLIRVPTNALRATNMLFSASAPLNLWFNETTPPSGTGSPGDYLLLNGVTAGSSVLSLSSSPTNIVDGGSYWLAVQNTNSSPVTYSIEVDFDVPGGSTHSSFSISAAHITSSGAQLQWTAPPGDKFQVEWATNLSQPMVWTADTNIITSSNGTFTFTDPGATNSPMRFYRLLRVQ